MERIGCEDTRGNGTGYPSKIWYIKQNIKVLTYSFDVQSGQSNKFIAKVPRGIFDAEDRVYIYKIALGLENAPGSGENITITVTDDVSTMTLNLSDSTTTSYNGTSAFTWNVNPSGQTLSIKYSSSAGCATGVATIVVSYWDTLYW